MYSKDILRPTRNVKIVKSDLSHNIMDMAQMIGFVYVNAKNKTLIIVMEKFIKAIKPFRSIKQKTESTTVLVGFSYHRFGFFSNLIFMESKSTVNDDILKLLLLFYCSRRNMAEIFPVRRSLTLSNQSIIYCGHLPTF